MNVGVMSAAEIARLAGTDGASAAALLTGAEFPVLRYRELSAVENRAVETQVESALYGPLRVSGENNPAVWERGWGEVARAVAGKAITVAALRPPYFRGEATCRLDGRYIRPLEAGFEYDASVALRRVIFDRFLRGFGTVVEIGCGTGLNLLLLAEQFANARLVGCDWAAPSRDIVNTMGRQSGRDIAGYLFNMLTGEGWDGAEIGDETAVLTVHAMEQLAGNWQTFADFVLVRHPGLVLHIEPIVELYGDSSFEDRARQYHLKRGYLRGYLPFLRQREAAGEIELEVVHRVAFGGLYHEGYSVVAWRPSG